MLDWRGEVGRGEGRGGGGACQRKLGGQFRALKSVNWRTGIQFIVYDAWSISVTANPTRDLSEHTLLLYAVRTCAMMLLVAFSTHDCIVVLTIGEGIVEIVWPQKYVVE